ncbi:MAG: hypothetical protein HQL73_01005 [Magnetococcales bacterium]|nr:hypothetical protein [Magnetococcales bacterium]
MFKKLILFFAATFFASMAFAGDIKCGADAANPDAECGPDMVCILVANPPVCKPPLPTGQPCKRDKVCASKTCERPAGAKPDDKGVCK